ncbi:TetR/AcrR family transcriptional regulator [Chitinophaga sp. Mgbs1]|uniref:TetR/AcrR family transcriptional regulator n=1 Tax=Chitinophaga solisilvae TaxID=1233460 RepID=A0A3S1BI34_9BACT|nr:TetR/AcrR family transcriptional regulator [Chitinophaga solisilvae]
MSGTREKIVEMADKLIRVKGYNAFSYKDIADPLEVKNAAIHYHFPAKSDLGEGVIVHELETFAVQREQWRRLPEDEQLDKLFDVFRRHCKAGNICLIGSLAPDFETLPEDMQGKIQEMTLEILEWVTACLEKGRKKKLFHFKGDAEDRALMVMSNLQSSLLLSRVLGPHVCQRITKRLLEDLR